MPTGGERALPPREGGHGPGGRCGLARPGPAPHAAPRSVGGCSAGPRHRPRGKGRAGAGGPSTRGEQRSLVATQSPAAPQRPWGVGGGLPRAGNAAGRGRSPSAPNERPGTP